MLTLPRHWAVPATLAAAALVAFLLPSITADDFAWVRAVNRAQPWRLFSGHLVHLDGTHLALNLAGLGLCWLLVGAEWRTAVWSLVVVLVAGAIGTGLYLFGDIGGYVGLSGLIHGLFAFGLFGMWRRWRFGALLGAAFLLGKTAGELWWPDAVIAEAHWLGTGAGAVLGIMATFVARRS